jgi:hypothetical protein
LEEVTIRLYVLDETSLPSLAVHEHHEHQRGSAAADEDNNECTESPSPAVLVVEHVGDHGCGESACDTRSSVEGEDDHAVRQAGAIRGHDVGNE